MMPATSRGGAIAVVDLPPEAHSRPTITATGANGQAVTVNTQVQGTVSAVNVSTNPPQVTVGGQSYPISSIQSINSGSSALTKLF